MSRSWVDIDLDAIRANARRICHYVGRSELCAVVKADGYGHGAADVAQASIDGGATRLAVAQVGEGIELRAQGVGAPTQGVGTPIWVLSEPAPDEFQACFEHQLEPAIYSVDAVNAATVAAASLADVGSGPRPTVHLKIDTGMGRVGANRDEAIGLASKVAQSTQLQLGSVWTHFSSADEAGGGDGYTQRQLGIYQNVLEGLKANRINVGLRHVANSAASIAIPEAHYDVVRCGIALYGLPPSSFLAGAFDLQPALSWHSRVGFVKRARAGSAISYGRRSVLPRDTTLVSIPVGYADGYRRSLWDSGIGVLIRGKRRPIVGVITMDQMVVDCGDDDVLVGDEVVLLGTQGDVGITASELAEGLETINYEITCGIGRRVERRYKNRLSA